jgi:hypothetical protein
VLAKYERPIADAISCDMAGCEFLDLCDVQPQANYDILSGGTTSSLPDMRSR